MIHSKSLWIPLLLVSIPSIPNLPPNHRLWLSPLHLICCIDVSTTCMSTQQNVVSLIFLAVHGGTMKYAKPQRKKKATTLPQLLSPQKEHTGAKHNEFYMSCVKNQEHPPPQNMTFPTKSHKKATPFFLRHFGGHPQRTQRTRPAGRVQNLPLASSWTNWWLVLHLLPQIPKLLQRAWV